VLAASLVTVGLVVPARAQAPASAPPPAPPPHAAEAPASHPVEAKPSAAASGEHAQPAAAPAHGASASQPSDSHAPAGSGHGSGSGSGESHESPWAFWGRLFNFAVLAGGLTYFLRTPLSNHLHARRVQITGDLESARSTARKAADQIAEIDRRLAHLPAELEALRERGAEEIAGEEAAIRQRAETERARLLEQTRREIELEVRLAQRQLADHTADLAVQLAADRVSRNITDDDRRRLLDRYVSRLKEFHG
jgi:F-type H+-transporting ATPase subunit b